jgi:UDP-N-acetylglucosamine--N-acetylmuramyl-(pentapeptide) pyrophosphoryl-undecaprenol N-acetylglucosamine transferase
MPKVMLAGGGTGGHLFPALAIADELKRRQEDVEIVFVGTKRGLESKLVPERGYRIRFLEVRGFRRRLDWRNLFFFYYLAKSLRQARAVLEEEKPSIVVGTGGYASGPPLRVARKMKISILIQEQNSYPGVTTRWLSHQADKVFLAYEESKKYFKRQDNLVVVGNPVRIDFARIEKSMAKRTLRAEEKEKVVLILGGSQGSRAINQTILDNLSQLKGQDWLQIIWQTGTKDFERVNSILQDKKLPITAIPFIQDIATAYAACDLVVSRAGALTLSEITLVGKPAILIPYPFAAADHQRKNAEVLVKENAAEMILEKNLSQANLVQRVLNLVQDESKLKAMSARSRKLGRPEALDKIVTSILSYLDKSKN